MTNPSCKTAMPRDRGALMEEFRAFVAGRQFPCVGAKSALNRDRIEFVVCDELGSFNAARELVAALEAFSDRHAQVGIEPVSLAAIFRHDVASEETFHEQLWRQLQAMHDIDRVRHAWAAGVSSDVAAADFSFSVAARAFFVVGLHPHASRLARRTPRPTLVFNFHDQFEALRATGRYDRMQAAIRERDIALQGDINPVLARFGEASEAFQYSGRAQGGCPFHARTR